MSVSVVVPNAGIAGKMLVDVQKAEEKAGREVWWNLRQYGDEGAIEVRFLLAEPLGFVQHGIAQANVAWKQTLEKHVHLGNLPQWALFLEAEDL